MRTRCICWACFRRNARISRLRPISSAAVSRSSPRTPIAHYNRGNVLRELKRLDEALASFDQAVALMPGHVEAWTNRGTVLQELGRSAEALASFDRALALSPHHLPALFNRANALRHLKRTDEGLASYDRVLELKPDHAEAHNGRGALLQELRRFPEALAAYDEAYRLDPNLDYVQGRRLHVKMAMCDWSNLDAERAQLDARADANRHGVGAVRIPLPVVVRRCAAPLRTGVCR